MVKKLFTLMLVTMFLMGCAFPKPLNSGEIVTPVEPPTTTTAVETVESVQTTTYRVTAYCSCSKCCGKWANNRPKDAYGNPIVYGASGNILKSNVSCAAPLPFGTQISLDGIGTVVVEDRIAKWVVQKHGENIIDLYFDNHQQALEFGFRYIEGVVVNGTPNGN